jgi:TPP-dependent indolepyruvate ferredoxin oxidoreductase alpha subunit
VVQTWPLDMDSFHEWAEGLDLIIVVEEKRKLIEVQVKEAIFRRPQGPPRLWLAQGRHMGERAQAGAVPHALCA